MYFGWEIRKLINDYSVWTVEYINCLLGPSANNLCKQFGPRSGPTKCRAWSGSNLFDILIVLQKEFFENVNFEKKISRRQKCMQNYPACKELNRIEVNRGWMSCFWVENSSASIPCVCQQSRLWRKLAVAQSRQSLHCICDKYQYLVNKILAFVLCKLEAIRMCSDHLDQSDS